jgi:GNAT superfamily N-acetyltransferase
VKANVDYENKMGVLWLDANLRIAEFSPMSADPDQSSVEFAVVTRSDHRRCGIGRLLMNQLIAYDRTRGVKELFGDVLAESATKLAFCSALDCAVQQSAVDRLFGAGEVAVVSVGPTKDAEYSLADLNAARRKRAAIVVRDLGFQCGTYRALALGSPPSSERAEI